MVGRRPVAPASMCKAGRGEQRREVSREDRLPTR
jgi:hypothetical protein